jgi:drug/metabolite transporter (DMT)-like permease
MMRLGDTAKGVILMAAATSLFPVSDAIAKLLAQSYPPVMVVWARFAVFAIAAIVAAGGLPAVRYMREARPGLQILCALLSLGATFFLIIALTMAPVVDAVTITFTMPLIAAALSAAILKERVGWHRWVAILTGFGGIVIAFRPGTGLFNPGTVFALVSATCSAFVQIAFRLLGGTDTPRTTMLYSALVGLAVLSLAVPFFWVSPDLEFVALTIVMGVAFSVAYLWMVRAFQLAPVTIISPILYTQIFAASVVGYLFFSDIPDTWILAGLAVIVGSGLFIFRRERAAVRMREPQSA